jgi:cell division protein FtsB
MEKVMFRSKREKKATSDKANPFNILVQFSLLGLSMFLLYNIVRSVQITTQKLEILKQAESEVDRLRIENVELILRKDTFQSDDYIETEARNRLNYSKNGEVLFVIPESTIEVAQAELERILTGKGQVEEKSRSVFEEWYDFFIIGV